VEALEPRAMLTSGLGNALDDDFVGDGSGGGDPAISGLAWEEMGEGEGSGSGTGGGGSGSGSGGGGGGPCENPIVTVSDGSTNEGALYSLSISASITGTCVLTGYDVSWGDGTSEYFSALDAVAHIYEDDNPTDTPADNYAVSVTAYWDDEQSASDDGIVTVNNVAPTVTIDYVPSSVDENESFLIQGTITDPGLADSIEEATLLIDLNFDGDTLDEGESVAIDLVSVGPGHWTFETPTGVVPDDGATYDAGVRLWGNGSATDPLPFTIEVEDDDTGTGSAGDTTEVLNVAPILDGIPELVYEMNEEGFVVSATVTGSFADPSSVDFHKVTVVWGSAGSKQEQLTLGGRGFSITEIFAPGAQIVEEDLYAYMATVEDDDGGLDSEEADTFNLLTIYNGGKNGTAVADPDEFAIGAFTVANMNDTDGDGLVDYSLNDTEVVAFTDAFGKVRGEDEVDLMKLVVHRPGDLLDGEGVDIVLREGDVRFWTQSTKGTQVELHPTTDKFAVEFGPGETSQTFWVEAPYHSNSLRDIVIDALHKRTKDTVRATAVWANKIAHESQTRTTDAVFSEDPWTVMGLYGPILAGISQFGGTGLRNPHAVHGLVNVIVQAWQLFPIGIESVSQVKFDITRRGESNRWERSDGNLALVPGAKITMPDRLDEVNDDDPFVADEDGPIGRLMFVYDSPGLNPLPDPPVIEFAQRKNFEEFMRVAIGGVKPSGNGLTGSRASNKFLWKSLSQAKKVEGVWSRAPVYNHIGAGNDYVSTPSPS
jgi:hypothetical protein